MPWLGALTAAGIVVAGILVWLLVKMFTKDHLDEILTKHKADAKIFGRAELVEGRDHIPVALALCGDVFYYENPDLQARLELERVDEVEYGNTLVIGQEVADGSVLRLRAHGAAFEFLLSKDETARWQKVLPARMISNSPVRAQA
ncbi:MAG: hypothetical protein WBX15_18325 [Thermoanaerobaculia bacterium]